jgi:hypothetical protein
MQRQPARGYSWPPFEKGNTLSVGNFGAVRHGAYSDRIITEKADHIRGLLLSSHPYLADETFSEAVLRYSVPRLEPYYCMTMSWKRQRLKASRLSSPISGARYEGPTRWLRSAVLIVV